jgi:hypothetical protein
VQSERLGVCRLSENLKELRACVRGGRESVNSIMRGERNF